MKSIIASAMAIAIFSGSAYAVEQPASAATCLACHAIDAKKIGPSFQEISAKYGADGKEQIMNSIKNGSQGVWGQIPMVPNQVSDEDASALADWIISTAQ